MGLNDFDSVISGYLEQLLSLHWLRPETAIWRTFDCLLMHDYKLDGKAIDLGCGDGTLSYIMAGGRIRNYDSYTCVTSLPSYNKGADIYNAEIPDNDSLDTDNSSLRYKYSFGIDHKAGLISKAKKFTGFYDHTAIHDLNDRLAFDDNYFNTAFSNVLYWLDNPDKVLNDWNRILTASGRLILFVPNENFKEKAWLYYSAPHRNGKKYYNFFDRGYSSLIKHCYPHHAWEDLFEQNGFMIVRHVKYLTDPVMEIWNIGTRPISPLLINMAANIIPEKRDKIKKEWVEYFNSFFLPIVSDEFGKDPAEDEYAFHFYVLEKKA